MLLGPGGLGDGGNAEVGVRGIHCFFRVPLGSTEMQFGPESLLPPIVAIALAIATRRVVIPLAAGVFTGAVLLAHRDPDRSWYDVPTVFIRAISESVLSLSHLQALAFSLMLGAMVGVIESGGGMRALVRWFSSKVHSRRGAQTMIATSGLAIFFDDYANSLLIGGTMRSTSDRYGISRQKLAYLVDSTAAPVAGLAVVGTWAAIEISYMGEGLRAGGITDSQAPFLLFIESIPYRFYPWLALAFVFIVAISGRDFGAMRTAEIDAVGGRASGGDPSAADFERGDCERRYLWVAAVLPVLVCILVVAAVLVVTGIESIGRWHPQDGLLRQAGEVFGNGDSYLALIYGSFTGLLVAMLSSLALGGCDPAGALGAALRGARQMMPALVILWFAWALSGMTDPDKLDTGGYLSSVLSDRHDIRLLPTVVFLLAGGIAFSTGTSWGTMGILTPLSIALAVRMESTGQYDSTIVLATCGSVLAGAIFGDHCSPISDTTVLSSQASGCHHVAHVRTQMPYAITVAAVCVLFGTMAAPLGYSPWISLIVGTIVLAVLMRLVGKQPRETDPGPEITNRA